MHSFRFKSTSDSTRTQLYPDHITQLPSFYLISKSSPKDNSCPKMKYTLAILALTLATFTSALPHPAATSSDDSMIERRGGGGDPYASKSVFKSNPYAQHEEDGDWEEEGDKLKERSPVAHGGKWDKWDGDDKPAYNADDPQTYDQSYWDSIGSEYPKKRSPQTIQTFYPPESSDSNPNPTKRSPVAHGGKWNKWNGDDNPAYNPDDPQTYDQSYWDSIGSEYPKKRSLENDMPAKRSPVAHGGKWNKWNGDDNSGYNADDPSTYDQSYWDSIGSEYPK